MAAGHSLMYTPEALLLGELSSASETERLSALDGQVDQTALDVNLLGDGLAGQSFGHSRLSL